MPTAVWPNVAPTGDVSYDYPPEKEPRGLFDFLGGQDMGVEIGDRLGVISQILMNLGSGRGGAGIAEATASVNERSAARREKRRMTTMVNRAADKIEPTNPELAAMMRANPAYGMQLIGKKYETEWESDADIRKQEKLLPWKIKEAKALKEAELESEKAKLLYEYDLQAKKMKNILGFDPLAPDAGQTTPPDTATAQPVVQPVPQGPGVKTDSDPGTVGPLPPPAVPQAPAAVVPTGPQQAPQEQLPVDPTQAQQPPAQEAFQFPAEAPSRNPISARIQRELSTKWGIPVAATDADRILEAMLAKDGTLGPIYANIQTRYDAKKQAWQDHIWEQQRVTQQQGWEAGAEQRAQQQRANVFESGLPEIKQPTGPIGPMPRDTAQPGQNPRDVAILQSQGLSAGRVGVEAAPAIARQFEQGAREGKLSDIQGDIATRIDKRTEDQRKELTLRAQQSQISRIIDPMLENEAFKNDWGTLAAMKVAKPEDVAGHLAKLSDTALDRFKTAQDDDQFNQTQKLAETKRADDEVERAFRRGFDLRKLANDTSDANIRAEEWQTKQEQATLAAKTLDENKKKFESAREVMMRRTASQVANLTNVIAESGVPVTGLIGTGISYLGDNSAGRVSNILASLTSNQALSEIQAMRALAEQVGAEGTGMGQTQIKEFTALETRWGNLSQFSNNTDSLLKEAKSILNMQHDIMYGENGGPYRIKVTGSPDFEKVAPDSAEARADREADVTRATLRGAEKEGDGEATLEEIQAEILKRRGGQ